MNNIKGFVPTLTQDEVTHFFKMAANSDRKRFPKILHNKGDYNNRVFNFLLEDTYMQPHMHPSREKVEKMYLVSGSFSLIFFDCQGNKINQFDLMEGGLEYIEVPAFVWHTYVMSSNKVIVFETMDGFYHPNSWKKMGSWAPEENTKEAKDYLLKMKSECGI